MDVRKRVGGREELSCYTGRAAREGRVTVRKWAVYQQEKVGGQWLAGRG